MNVSDVYGFLAFPFSSIKLPCSSYFSYVSVISASYYFGVYGSYWPYLPFLKTTAPCSLSISPPCSINFENLIRSRITS